MYFPRRVFFVFIIALYEIVDYARSESDDLNLFNDDDVNSETTLLFAGNGNDDESLTADNAINKQLTTTCVGTTGQEDLLFSSSVPSTNIDLFARDRNHPDHEQCLPPVNIGADALNLWKDPLFELERQMKTPGSGPGGSGPGPGPGPEGPKLPPLLVPFDNPELPEKPEEDPESNPLVWQDYEGSVYDEFGWRIGSYGSERLEEDVVGDENGIDEEDYNPCTAPWRPDGYAYDLCCNGPAYKSRQVTGWKYDAVESCDWSEFFPSLLLFLSLC